MSELHDTGTPDPERAQVRLTRKGKVAILSFDRPERMNVFSLAMRDALIDHIETLQSDEDTRAIVLTGEGPHFTCGGDLDGFHETTALAVRQRLLHGSTKLMRLMVAGIKPVIGAAEGNCYGAGVSILAACDHAVVAEDSRLCAAFIKVGFLPDLALLWSLPRRVGLGKAKELAGLAPVVDGAEAVRIGLADRLAPSGGTLAAALEVAQAYAEQPPLATAMLKAAFARDLDAVLAYEQDIQPALIGSPEHLEAKRAFLEKRKPDFDAAARRPAFET
ncbi:enoyl-CoA hydratase/isomerase family protein [Tropicimonas isoalkanivorans]|uniref:Enoyl-CoA hydratase/carnithine racemase n=1 Tax=Tropicimonas isoalkanivorans TaxID=441112 RepID=A0A1I1HWV3_9RHOB|nr:enoyl-CoA hydratase/isomerase family protein [Tropicimonas isoalkanivorans]SFC28052.1 Enoyl-CoA hydratase/carnithine racemase [Tropicimonas isoalkanivorans]